MDLKRRLARLDQLSRRRQGTEGTGSAGDTGRERRPEDVATLCQQLGLTAREHGGETLWQRDYRDGDPSLPARFQTELPDLQAIFTRETPADLRPTELLFCDTETTGLAGGTGSLAFLIGCAWWEEDRFRIRQYFLSGPGQEGPILAALAELAASFRGLVTFNGNSFDLPLLRTRAMLARLHDPFVDLASWDLLPAVRRLWGRALPDCCQQTLESTVCGRERGPGDIDGARIPHTYFQYLRQGRIALLDKVLEHNRRDLTGMADILLAVLTRAVRLTEPIPAANNESRVSWTDAWSNARILETRHETALATDWIVHALSSAGWSQDGVLPSVFTEIFCRDVVRLLKRSARWRLLDALLFAALARFGDRPWLHQEAAILHEHRLHHLDTALYHAERLGDQTRLARVQRKLAARVAPALTPPDSPA
ncbi:MAG: ribonuclease H-like domain-containing protein [bacterium]